MLVKRGVLTMSISFTLIIATTRTLRSGLVVPALLLYILLDAHEG